MTITVSYSELDTAKQCPLKHQFAYVERWSKPQLPDSALAKGTAWHLVLETHYNALRRGGTLAAARDAVEIVIEGRVHEDLRDLVWWMYNGYTDYWGADDDWKILAVEHAAECRLLTPSGHRSQFVLKMKIDLVVREKRTGNIKVIDHKSGKDLPTARAFELDDQFGLYTWAMRQMGKRVFSSEWNAARTLRLKADLATPGATPLDERFKRIPLYRTDKELTMIAQEAYLQARARYRQQREVKALGIDSPRHTDPDRCNWKCDYQEPCLAGRKGVDMRKFLRAKGFEQDFTRH